MTLEKMIANERNLRKLEIEREYETRRWEIEHHKKLRRVEKQHCTKKYKEALKFEREREKCSYFTLLERYYERQRDGKIYNPVVILACWELINDE